MNYKKKFQFYFLYICFGKIKALHLIFPKYVSKEFFHNTVADSLGNYYFWSLH